LDDLRDKAKDFLSRYHPSGSIPVPIDDIVELELRISVIPVEGLSHALGEPGLISRDLLTIRIDQNVLEKKPFLYRTTIAHEAGHGLHFVLSQKQSMLNYHAPLPLAETASVFGEMLLTRMLLDRESDPAVRRSLLCAKIEDIIATTFRQTVLTRFELRLHSERSNGLLSNDRIGEIWLEENTKLFGDAVEMIPAYRWGWSYISHFIHSRFYCYSYTFAELLVLTLFQKYREDGDGFKAGYHSLLESGGSLSPADTARLAGIDINEENFWQKGYDFLAELIRELKAVA